MKTQSFTHFIVSFLLAITAFETCNAQMENTMPDPIRDICNLDLLYTDAYTYSLPRNILQSFLSGKAFDNKEVYTDDEAARLDKDINGLWQVIMATNPVQEKWAVITAGAPGAGKTTKLRQDLKEQENAGLNYAYACPDDVCLKGQDLICCSD